MRSMILIATIFAFGFSTHAANLEAPDTAAPGPLAVATAEYKFPAIIDQEVLATAHTELWARVFWPKQITKVPHPILFFLHGNHSTCGSGSNPRSDFDCTYTQEGVCPEGQVVVPNHEGYNYLGEHLASWGYIVVTINANRGITCGAGDVNDWGLNIARGRLVLRHLEQWYKWTTSGGAPATLGVPDTAFVGAVDLSNVGLMGHSRGGEGMRAAYNLHRDSGSLWPDRIPGLKIKAIYEIGAVDGQTSRTLDADDTAWNQLLPMCDGDVSTLEGRIPFERMITKSHETHPSPKSIYMAWGTNHNFFNTEWQTNDSWSGCSGHEPIFGDGPVSEEQKKIALVSTSAFFRAHVGINAKSEFSRHFNPTFSLPSSVTAITRIDRDYIPTFDELINVRVEDFDQPTGTNSHMYPNAASGVEVDHERAVLPARARVSWTSPGKDTFLDVNWTKDGEGQDISGLGTLDFRVARQSEHSGSPDVTDFSIQLINADGSLSNKVSLSRYTTLVGPANAVTVFQTARIPLFDFGKFDRKTIRGVRFTFDASPTGAIYLAHVRFSMPDLFNLVPSAPIATHVQGLAFTTAPKPRMFSAKVVGIRNVARSRFFKSQNSIEIEVKSQARFTPEDQLPYLSIGEKLFPISRYPKRGDTYSLIFTIPRQDYAKLPRRGPMQVQYGRVAPSKIWRLPDYDKASLGN